MRKITAILGITAALAAGFIGYAWYVDGRGAVDTGSPTGPLHLSGTTVEQGRYLAAAANCGSCHTVTDGEPFAGGVAFRLPFGTIYSSNLTPDPATGIGSWSDDEFLRAVRGGVGRGGRHLYPAHPYATYAAMARNDVLAIKAYLASLPAVVKAVPDSDLQFPYSQRGLMRLWNALYLDERRFQNDASHDEAWNRGAYLANALGHCGECHTPRNAAYALQHGRAFSGAVTRGWKAYDITAGADGLGDWSEAALEEYLATGHAAGHGSTTGPMKDVVIASTSQLTAEDRHALAAYLLAGRPPGAVVAAPAIGASSALATTSGGLGANLYAGACAGCHALDPGAATGAYSDLAGARTVRDSQGTNLLRLLSEGSPHGVAGGTAMPGFGRGYSDAERAALANFVLAQWGRLPPSLTPNDAARARAAD